MKGAAGQTGCRQDRAVIAFCFRHDGESSKRRAWTDGGGAACACVWRGWGWGEGVVVVVEINVALPGGTSDAEP